MMIASIRKIVMIESDSNNEFLRKSSCTCPDWFTKGFCPHLLACLAQNNKFKLDFKLKTTRKMGRRARVAAALIRE